jgi:hypothetical protein
MDTGICKFSSILNLTILSGTIERTTTVWLYKIVVMVAVRTPIARHGKLTHPLNGGRSPSQHGNAVDWSGLVVGILICTDALTSET